MELNVDTNLVTPIPDDLAVLFDSGGFDDRILKREEYLKTDEEVDEARKVIKTDKERIAGQRADTGHSLKITKLEKQMAAAHNRHMAQAMSLKLEARNPLTSEDRLTEINTALTELSSDLVKEITDLEDLSLLTNPPEARTHDEDGAGALIEGHRAPIGEASDGGGPAGPGANPDSEGVEVAVAAAMPETPATHIYNTRSKKVDSILGKRNRE